MLFALFSKQSLLGLSKAIDARRLLSTTAAAAAAAASVHGSHNNQVGQIWIDNPTKSNAMTLQMYQDVPSACAASSHPTVRVCLLSGRGTAAFGAGSDIAEFPQVRTGAQQAAAYSKHEDKASEALLSFQYPLLAKIHGPCYGGALNLALAADLRYASADATFCVPPAKLGIGYPRSLMQLLVQAVGKTNAKDLLFTARVVTAHEAQAMGLVTAVLPKEELDEYVDQVATNITQLAPLTLKQCKLELQGHAVQEADRAYKDCYDSEDYTEGVASFLERRPVFFQNK